MRYFEALLILTWFTRMRFTAQEDADVLVVQTLEDVPLDVEVGTILVDMENKHEWSEEVDEWFHLEVLPALTRDGTGTVQWCKREERELPDAAP